MLYGFSFFLTLCSVLWNQSKVLFDSVFKIHWCQSTCQNKGEWEAFSKMLVAFISCFVRVNRFCQAILGFTWETVSEMSTSSVLGWGGWGGGGGRKVDGGAGKCGWSKVTTASA